MKPIKSMIFWLVAFILLSVIMNNFTPTARQNATTPIAFSEFMDKAENSQIESVTIVGNDIYGNYNNGSKFRTYAPFDPSMVETLRKYGVKIEARPIDTSESTFWGIVISWFPMLLLIGVWIFFMRQANSGNNKAMSFGKSRARLIENTKKVTFADVAGADDDRFALTELLDGRRSLRGIRTFGVRKLQRVGGNNFRSELPEGVRVNQHLNALTAGKTVVMPAFGADHLVTDPFVFEDVRLALGADMPDVRQRFLRRSFFFRKPSHDGAFSRGFAHAGRGSRSPDEVGLGGRGNLSKQEVGCQKTEL